MKRRRSDPSRVSSCALDSIRVFPFALFSFFFKKKVYICSDEMKKKARKNETHENGSDLSAERRSVTDRMRD